MPVLLIGHKLGHILRTAGLDAGPQRGFSHPPEGLAQRDGAGGASIYIQIAGLDVRFPVILLTPVETFDARGQAISGLVDQRDSLLEIFGLHHRQQRTEELRHMGVASRRDDPT